MDYREKIVHGDEGLPVAIYDISPEHIRYRMNIHWHPEHEILYVISGTMHLRLNDIPFELSAGDVIFIPGGTIHSGEPENGGCYACFLVNLALLMKKSDVCMEFAERIRTGNVRILPRLGARSPDFANLCDRMLRVYRRKEDGYPFEIKGLIFIFFGKIFNLKLYEEEPRGKKQGEITSGRLKTAITYIEDHYTSPLRLEELARQADMTPNHFCRCFKAVTGMTPFSYLKHYRLMKAQYALKTTDLPITTVALDCGFNDVSYFIRAFRETYGYTPKQYQDNPSPF